MSSVGITINGKKLKLDKGSELTLVEGSDLKLNNESALTILDTSELALKGVKDDEYHEHVHLDIHKVQCIAPVAAHIKEVNHIDPISIDALHVSEVKNIEPIKVEKFNITNLPMVNMSLRQIPPLNLNVRRLPPVSIGAHQNFHIPSDYTIRARFFGIEFFRMRMNGRTVILPKDHYHREQARTQNRSFPVPAAAGNPAIPSKCHEKSVRTYHPPHHPCGHRPVNHSRFQKSSRAQTLHTRHEGHPANAATGTSNKKKSGLHFGRPAMNFGVSETKARQSNN